MCTHVRLSVWRGYAPGLYCPFLRAQCWPKFCSPSLVMLKFLSVIITLFSNEMKKSSNMLIVICLSTFIVILFIISNCFVLFFCLFLFLFFLNQERIYFPLVGLNILNIVYVKIMKVLETYFPIGPISNRINIRGFLQG